MLKFDWRRKKSIHNSQYELYNMIPRVNTTAIRSLFFSFAYNEIHSSKYLRQRFIMYWLLFDFAFLLGICNKGRVPAKNVQSQQ